MAAPLPSRAWLAELLLLAMLLASAVHGQFQVCTCAQGGNTCVSTAGGSVLSICATGPTTNYYYCADGSSASCSSSAVCPCGVNDVCGAMAANSNDVLYATIQPGYYESTTFSCLSGSFPAIDGGYLYTTDGSTFTVAIRTVKTDVASPSDIYTSAPTSCFKLNNLIYQPEAAQPGSSPASTIYAVVSPTVGTQSQTIYGTFPRKRCYKQGSIPCSQDSDCPTFNSTIFPTYCTAAKTCAQCPLCYLNNNWIAQSPSNLCPAQCTQLAEMDWNYGDFPPCNASCGGGLQVRSMNCYAKIYQDNYNVLAYGGVVNNVFCQIYGGPQPPTQQACNTQSCYSLAWSSWSSCSTSCGGGTYTRSVQCQDYLGNVQSSSAPCSASAQPSGSSVGTCNPTNTVPCYNWMSASYSACLTNTYSYSGSACGTGQQSITSGGACCGTTASAPQTCLFSSDGSFCNASLQPPAVQSCSLGPCQGPPPSSSSPSSRVIVGAVGASVLGVALVAAVVLAVIYRRRRRVGRGHSVPMGPVIITDPILRSGGPLEEQHDVYSVSTTPSARLVEGNDTNSTVA